MKDLKTTNPIAVGDRVLFETEANQKTAVITGLLPRRNYIIRRSINLSKQTQIIAANIDQAMLVITLAKPRTSFGFIDRFLVTAEAYHIPTLLIFNKMDIYTDEDLSYLDEIITMYLSNGYRSICVSALKNEHIDDLKKELAGKTTLFSGHSGVGKSTLINRILPDIHLKTSGISDFSSKGVHTTTFAEMYFLPEGGAIIDTPGIKELGVVDLENGELAHYFPEMKALINQCRFNNCMHLNEPGCAVKKAVDEGKLALTRYDSYVSILLNEDNRK